jgi:3-deoxy-D-manno-octulosonic-acid transferase
LGKYQRFFYKSHDDAKRYQSLGVAVDKGEVAGDMKFDTPLPDRSPALVRKWRDRIGVDENDFVFVAGSTRDGEERLLLDIFENLRAEYPRLRMVLAPRHVERAGSIVDMVKRRGLGVAIFGKDQAEITIVDRVGLLNDLYLAADLAFVGGTLVDIGGHNLLEPVWAGTPVLFGPSLDNVPHSAKYITEYDFGTMVDDVEDLEKQIREVLTGHRKFAIKNDSDLSNSATAIVGDYILKRLNHA